MYQNLEFSKKCLISALTAVFYTHEAGAQNAAVVKNGSTFSWVNQAGATYTGGGSSPLIISQPAHPNSYNQAALVTPMSNSDACYDALISVTDPDGYYNSGMILTSSTTNTNTLFEDIFGNTSGASLWVNRETNFSQTNSTIFYNQGGSASYPIGSEFFERICVSGQNISFLASPTGSANTFQILLTTTLSTLGNPDHIGFYTDAAPFFGQTYSSSFQLLKWHVYTSNTPQTADSGGDLQGNFLTTPQIGAGIPVTNSAPITAGDTPKFGLALAATANNVADLTFPGSGEPTITISNSAMFRKYIYVNSTAGYSADADHLVGSPQDFSQGENGPFWGAERTYLSTSNNDLIPVTADGLKIKAHCAGASYSNCAMNQVRSGAFRLPTDFRPGMTMELTYRPATGYHSWTPWWLYSGAQTTSYPNSYGQAPGAIGQSGNGTTFEIDLNDNYPRHDSGGCPIGGQVDFGTPNIYGVGWNMPPSMFFAANSNGWLNRGPRAG